MPRTGDIRIVPVRPASLRQSSGICQACRHLKIIRTPRTARIRVHSCRPQSKMTSADDSGARLSALYESFKDKFKVFTVVLTYDLGFSRYCQTLRLCSSFPLPLLRCLASSPSVSFLVCLCLLNFSCPTTNFQQHALLSRGDGHNTLGVYI
jgi:hypothetical protein